MPTYTAYPLPTEIGQLFGSTEEILDDIRVDRAVNGAAKVRAFYPNPKRRFNPQHRMTPTQYADFITFYESYRLVTFSFTPAWPPGRLPYTVMFEGAPRVSPEAGVDVSVSCTLAEQ